MGSFDPQSRLAFFGAHLFDRGTDRAAGNAAHTGLAFRPGWRPAKGELAVDSVELVLLVRAAVAVGVIERGDLVGGQEAATGASWPAHGVVMARLVQIRLATFRREPQLLLEFLPGNTALEDAVKLLGVDIER